MSEVNMDKYCRVCMCESNLYSPIYEEQLVDSLLFEVINDVCGLDVTMDDGFPKYICCPCYIAVSKFELFKRRAHAVTGAFQRMKQGIQKSASKGEKLEQSSHENDSNAVMHDASEPEEVQSNSSLKRKCKRLEEKKTKERRATKNTKRKEEEGNESGENSHFDLRSVSKRRAPVGQMTASKREKKKIAKKKKRKESGLDKGGGSGRNKLVLCDVCGKGFSFLCHLRTHMRIHTGIKPYKCEQCQRSFSQSCILKWHKLTHTGDRPYMCDICGNRFSQPATLSRHKLIHSGEKRHHCHQCTKAFLTKGELKVHLESHSRDRTYLCDVCHESFSLECDLVKHLLTHEYLDQDDGPNETLPSNLDIYGMKGAPGTVPNADKSKGAAIASVLHPVKLQEEVSETVNIKIANTLFNNVSSGILVGGSEERKSHALDPEHSEMQESCQNVCRTVKSFKCDVFDMAFSLNADLQSHRFAHAGENLHVMEQKLSLAAGHKLEEVKNEKANSHKSVRRQNCNLGYCSESVQNHQEEMKSGHTHVPAISMSYSQKSEVISLQCSKSLKSTELEQGILSDYINKPAEATQVLGHAASLCLDQKSEKVRLQRDKSMELNPLEQAVFSGSYNKSNEISGEVLTLNSCALEQVPSSASSQQHWGEISLLEEKSKEDKLQSLALCVGSGQKFGETCVLEVNKEKSVVLHRVESFGVDQKLRVDNFVPEKNEETTQGANISSNQIQTEIFGGKYKLDIAIIPRKTVTESSSCESGNRRLNSSKPYRCNVCEKEFSFNWVFKAHQRLHTGETPFECQACGRKFSEKFILNAHMLTHKPFKCDRCDRSYLSKNRLIRHKKTHLWEEDRCKNPSNGSQLKPRHHRNRKPVEKMYRCDVCDKSYASESNLTVHKRTHSGSKPYECHVCSKRFSEYFSFNAHRMMHVKEKPYRCDVCSKSFPFKHSLRKHLTVHTGQRPYECKECDKAYKSKEKLQAHARSHTGERPYKCDICDASFAYQNYLSSHVRSHTGERPYKCEYCDKAYVQASSLTVHRRKHTGQRPYKCPACEMTFCDPSTWKSHKLTHTKEKKYECEVCHKMFGRLDYVTTHKKRHLGVRPHKCDLCDKSFLEPKALKDHRMVHTGERPHSCGICGKGFSRAYNLRTHMKVHSRSK